MNERYGYDPYGQQQGQQPPEEPRFLGYDEYGQPVYGYEESGPYGQQTAQPGQSTQPGQSGQQGYGYDAYDGRGGHEGYGAYGQQAPPQPYPQNPMPQPQTQQHTQQEWIPQQQSAAGAGVTGDRGRAGGQGQDSDGGYRTEEFSFVEEQADDSDDVIDWLKFSESRTERREEAKRRGRNRIVLLVVALVMIAAGGVGYLWYAGKLPDLNGDKGGAATAAGQQRDVIVVHLRSLNGGGSSTALLVDNVDAKRGNTVLLPNSLAVSGENGTTTTLAKAVEDEGTAPTREALGTLLGADIKGSWRLDTPYLENLVELVGGIKVDANATVPGEKKGDEPLVKRGRAQTLDGRAAVGYATYRGKGEPQTRQLERFGEVMHQTLRKLSSDSKSATKTVETLGQIPDPSLPEPELGASLAKLASQAKGGAYKTQVLPVRANGTLSEGTSEGLVKQVLGGTVKNTDPDAAPRVKIVNASGKGGSDDTASAALVNSGYTVVKGGAGDKAQARSQVTYADGKYKAKAQEVAKTLGLPGNAVRKGKGAANADVAVVLGRDYKE
ncbi:LCP family protein [Streptomyces bathyalis]|uniref:LCP family protein n=1 Tax=Streptomyces bathyalis TaxID=2710756 RepID=A0A7T1T9I7_9ACTN|nr:LCP family protein [Streptomyces bathyalis]QPP08901.1 LCP family protein [Streptomyces bathyalis]